ncbi:MAG: RagB/SusD family nutrient uptake outer membrane protein, partial [Chitinophaga rupis]
MKTYQIVLFFAALVFLTAPSCKKYYENVPVEQVTPDYIWDTQDSVGTLANAYLTTIYTYLPLGFNRINTDFLDAASDDAISSQSGASDISTMAHGGITIFSNPDNTWASDYAGIRRATIFLNNFKVVPMKNIYERNARLGEARTLRAFFYWELVRRWGGVPLLGDNIKTLTDDIELPRRSFESCIDYIVSECDKAKDSLRTDPVDDNNLGRWTKAGAMALKAQVLLFAASPLYNGGNTGDSLTGYTSNDPTRWQRAAAAAKDIIDMNVYKLDSPLTQIFIETKSPEIIFAKT